MAYKRKQLLAKVSGPSGGYLKTWANINFQSFTKTLNGGAGECVITYAVNFDYNGQDLAENNDVELWISDADTLADTSQDHLAFANAKLIYKGYISLIERDIDGSSETVTVHILGYYTRLDLDILKSTTQTTLYSINTGTGLTTTSGSNAAGDIGLMVRGVMARFNAETSTKLTYDTTSVPNTGTTAKYIFTQMTYREALDALKGMAPTNVYWYVDATGKLSFKAVPTTPTYTFIFGRHFTKAHVERSLEKVRNVALIYSGTSGGTYKHYEDLPSIALYGRRTERITSRGIAASGAADAMGAKFLAENKDAALVLKATIFDNNNTQALGADIEAIEPGHTCSIVGYSSNVSNIFQDNMIITQVTYRLDSVDITVELVKSNLFDNAALQDTAIDNINSQGSSIPDTYS